MTHNWKLRLMEAITQNETLTVVCVSALHPATEGCSAPTLTLENDHGASATPRSTCLRQHNTRNGLTNFLMHSNATIEIVMGERYTLMHSNH